MGRSNWPSVVFGLAVLQFLATAICHALEVGDGLNRKHPLNRDDKWISVVEKANIPKIQPVMSSGETSIAEKFQVVQYVANPNVLSRIKRKSGRSYKGSKRGKGHRPDTSVQKAGLFDVLKKNALKVIANTARHVEKEIVNQLKNAGPRELLCGITKFLDLKSTRPLPDKFISLVKHLCKHNGNVMSMLADVSGRRKRSGYFFDACLPFGLGKKDIVWAFSENVSNAENIVKSIIASTVSDVICNYLNVIYLDISEDEDELSTLLDAAGSQVCEVNSACPDDEYDEGEEDGEPPDDGHDLPVRSAANGAVNFSSWSSSRLGPPLLIMIGTWIKMILM